MGNEIVPKAGALTEQENFARLERDCERILQDVREFEGLKVVLRPSLELAIGQCFGHKVEITVSKRDQGERTVTVPLLPNPQGMYSAKQMHDVMIQLTQALNELLGMWAARLIASRTPGKAALPAPVPAKLEDKS